MRYEEIDALAANLQRIGQSGPLPKGGPQALLVDELQRQLGVMKAVLLALLQDRRESPRHGRDSDLFTIDARAGTDGFNILTSAQADKEGLGATTGLAVFRHGRGIPLDRWVTVWFTVKAPVVGVGTDQPARSGGPPLVFAFDENRTVFQIDDDALAQEAVYVVSGYSRRAPMTGPNRKALAGVPSPTPGLVDASTLPSSEFP